MMRKTILALALVSPLSAHAEGMYMGLDYAHVTVDVEGRSDSVNMGAMRGTIGAYVNHLVGIQIPVAAEGRLGFGFLDDDIDGIDISTDLTWGAYLRAELPIAGALAPYGIVGFSYAKVSADLDVVDVSADDTGFSFGVGASYQFNERITLNAEYLRLVEDVNTFSFGVRYGL